MRRRNFFRLTLGAVVAALVPVKARMTLPVVFDRSAARRGTLIRGRALPKAILFTAPLQLKAEVRQQIARKLIRQ